MRTQYSPRVAAGLHADRAAGRDRDHRGPDRPAAAGRPGGPRGRPPRPVRQQPQADRPGDAQLPRHQQRLPPGVHQRPAGAGVGRVVDPDRLLARPDRSPRSSRTRSTTRSTSTCTSTAAGEAIATGVVHAARHVFLCPSDGEHPFDGCQRHRWASGRSRCSPLPPGGGPSDRPGLELQHRATATTTRSCPSAAAESLGDADSPPPAGHRSPGSAGTASGARGASSPPPPVTPKGHARLRRLPHDDRHPSASPASPTAPATRS